MALDKALREQVRRVTGEQNTHPLDVLLNVPQLVGYQPAAAPDFMVTPLNGGRAPVTTTELVTLGDTDFLAVTGSHSGPVVYRFNWPGDETEFYYIFAMPWEVQSADRMHTSDRKMADLRCRCEVMAITTFQADPIGRAWKWIKQNEGNYTSDGEKVQLVLTACRLAVQLMREPDRFDIELAEVTQLADTNNAAALQHRFPNVFTGVSLAKLPKAVHVTRALLGK